jgi:hypothetical protein
MAAKKGNKYAEKWDKITVLEALNSIYADVEKNRIFYLGVTLANIDLYNTIWTDWQDKFREDKEVSQAIKRIEAKIEANLLSQAASNKINATIAIFVLKNKYKWSDKQEIDHTSKGESIIWNEVKQYGKDSN